MRREKCDDCATGSTRETDALKKRVLRNQVPNGEKKKKCNSVIQELLCFNRKLTEAAEMEKNCITEALLEMVVVVEADDMRNTQRVRASSSAGAPVWVRCSHRKHTRKFKDRRTEKSKWGKRHEMLQKEVRILSQLPLLHIHIRMASVWGHPSLLDLASCWDSSALATW